MSSPEISVIVPVYNAEKYLVQCLESALSQTLPDFELILVNDGSTDRSPGICDEYALRDSRILVAHHPNQGLSAAPNAGLGLASGRYPYFLDSDDWLDPETPSVAHDAAENASTDVVLWPYVREHEGLSLPKQLFRIAKRMFDALETRVFLCRRMVGLVGEELRAPENADALVTACCKQYRRDLIESTAASFVDTVIIGTEDALSHPQVLTHATVAVYVNRPLYHYRRDNTSSLTTRYKPSLPQQWTELHHRMHAHIREHDLGVDFETALRNRISLSIIGLGLNALGASRPCERLNAIRFVLSADHYRAAVSTLDLRHLPVHWRLFCTTVKTGRPVLVYGLLTAVSELRKWRNRAAR